MSAREEPELTRIAVIGGDGIGPEVVGAGIRVLEAASEVEPSVELDFTGFPWSCGYYWSTAG